MASSLLIGLALASGLGVAAGVLGWRWARDRSYRRAMAQRLLHTYDPVPLDEAQQEHTTLPLRSPVGRVAICPDGLCLHLGRPPEDLRLVPWSRVKSVVPVSSGRFVVDVSRVGPVEIPGEVGRRLWESFGRDREMGFQLPVERARSGRV